LRDLNGYATHLTVRLLLITYARDIGGTVRSPELNSPDREKGEPGGR